LPVYINRVRPLDYATSVRQKARAKAERYEDLKRGFEDWARQENKTDGEIADGLKTLDDLIAYWCEQAETGER
jgi:hypothetical protein